MSEPTRPRVTDERVAELKVKLCMTPGRLSGSPTVNNRRVSIAEMLLDLAEGETPRSFAKDYEIGEDECEGALRAVAEVLNELTDLLADRADARAEAVRLREERRQSSKIIAGLVAKAADVDGLREQCNTFQGDIDNVHAELTRQRTRADAAEAEVAKLKAVIAAHDLCHDLHGKVGVREFADGCTAEQRKLFGCAPDADEVGRLREENRRLQADTTHTIRLAQDIEARWPALKEVVHWSQALLTALNVGDVRRGSLLHQKLRQVMIAYREVKVPNQQEGEQ